MKGDPKVIQFLNTVLKNELTANNQYFLHYRMLDHWGVKRLAKFEYGESIDEMKHADRIAERILFLDGLPNFQMLGRLRIGEAVEEVVKDDLDLDRKSDVEGKSVSGCGDLGGRRHIKKKKQSKKTTNW